MENLENIDITFFDKLLEFISSYKFYVPVITVLITFILINSLSKVVKRLINKDSHSVEVKKKNTIISLVQNIIKYILIIIAALIILGTWGVNITGIVASLGIVGVVAGLAIQDALKDIIMGSNIIMDNYYVVGDLVTYGDFTGTVIEFGLKNTKIKSADGTVFIVANRNISEIKNLSQKDATLILKVPTRYEDKCEKIEKVLNEICEKIDALDKCTGKSEVLGIDEFNDSSVDYLISVHCTAHNRFAFKRQVLGIIKREFESKKIEIPYNQIEVHNG